MESIMGTNWIAVTIGVSAAILNGLINLNSNETDLVKYISILFIVVEIVAFYFSSRYINYTNRLIVLGTAVLVFQITLTTYYGLIELSSRGESYEAVTNSVIQKEAECKTLQANFFQAQSNYTVATTEMANAKRRQETKDNLDSAERRYANCTSELKGESSKVRKKTLLNQAGETVATWIVLIRSVLLALCSLLFLGISSKLKKAHHDSKFSKETIEIPEEEIIDTFGTSSRDVGQSNSSPQPYQESKQSEEALDLINSILAKNKRK